MTRIAFVGAGSVEFTRDLLGDILSFPELADATIALHDIDPERLAAGEAMARWTNQALGAHATIEAHLDRRAALEGCDHVINMIQVGGHAATLIDFEIPKRHGLRQTIGDTLGIGGIFRALRTIPVMLGIAADMAELCPDAWLLNYTNPMAMLCWATYEASRPDAHRRPLPLRAEHHPRAGRAGRRALRGGRPTWAPASTTRPGSCASSATARTSTRCWTRRSSATPSCGAGCGSRCTGGFGVLPDRVQRALGRVPALVPAQRRDDRAVPGAGRRVRAPQRGEPRGCTSEMRGQLAAGEPFEIERSLEYASLIIHSMVTGEPRVIYGNVRNDGLIPNLPHGCCVEVPCLVDRTGVQPTAVGALPPQLAALNRTFLNVCELTVRAALDGSRAARLPRRAARPERGRRRCRPRPSARMVDDLIDAHGDAIDERIRAGGRRSAYLD